MAANALTRAAADAARKLGAIFGFRPRPKVWSIGIYAGASPLNLASAEGARNPVLAAADVTDLRAAFVADPFIIRDGATWHVFFEAMDADARRGVVARAESADGLAWTYRGVALAEPFHLSYPFVFRHGGEIYMTCESPRGGVRLYRAERFPDRWTRAATLVTGRLADPTLFEHEGRWWMFAGKGNAALRLFVADRPEGPWREHPKSPLIARDKRAARPAGRVALVDGRLVRFAQDCVPTYGAAVRAFEITRLTPDDYAEHPLSPDPILSGSGSGWNASGMHHLDAHPLSDGRWLAAVDGFRRRDDAE